MKQTTGTLAEAAPDTGAAHDEDAALLAAFAQGDRTAAAVLTDRLLPRVYGLALRMTGDRAEAEDIAQEAMVRLWRIAPDWEPGGAKISTWLYRVVKNLCVDHKRRRRGRDGALEDAPEPMDEGRSAAEPDARYGTVRSADLGVGPIAGPAEAGGGAAPPSGSAKSADRGSDGDQCRGS